MTTGRTMMREDARIRVVRFIRFGLVGGSGLLVNTLALFAATGLIGLHYLVGAALATQVSTAWNFSLTEVWVFKGRWVNDTRWRRFGRFWLVNNSALAARGPLIWFLTSALGLHYLASNLVTLVLVMLVRFALADLWIWRGGSVGEARAAVVHGG